MPWQETCYMDERMRFIVEWLSGDWTRAELCRRYGVSRKTGYKWVLRYQEHGPCGLLDRPRAPLRHPATTPEVVEEAILEARREYGWGPTKLRRVLMKREPDVPWPSRATFANVLKRNGLVAPRKRRCRTEPSHSPLAHVTEPNQVWSADFKGWFRTADGARCDTLTIMDAHSRMLIRCEIVDPQTRPVRGVFEAAFKEYGKPLKIRTDNGTPFASTGLTGLCQLSVWWIEHGIEPERIDPGKPQQNGGHERMHLTLNHDVCSPQFNTLTAQKDRMQWFRERYNTVRPHEALNHQTPSEHYIASSLRYQASVREVAYPDALAIRRVRNNGSIKWKGKELHLSLALRKKTIAIEDYNDQYHLVRFCKRPVAFIDISRHAMRRLSKGPKITPKKCYPCT